MCISVAARLKLHYHDIVKNEDLTPLFSLRGMTPISSAQGSPLEEVFK
jgi:hypothetical protein